MPVLWIPEHTGEPDDVTELRSQVVATNLAHNLRMARNGSSTHPDLREPDWDDADMIAASEADEQENDE